MANRFATGQDYSQTFQYLYDQNASAMEAAASRIDSKREGELAAEDSLIFAKWQEGKISGAQLMAHIRHRQAQTGYDRTQNLKWREAAITYGNVIGDEQAEANYATNQNINALIQHYSGRLAETKAGTPERRELATRLRTLRDTRDSDSLRKQGRKIARAVERGDMNTNDLIAFYVSKLPELHGDLKQTVLDTIAELRTKRRNENFEVAMQKIDSKLASGQISPQDAAKQKMDVLGQFDIQTRDKVTYSKWLEQVRQLRATPDPAEVQQLDFDLAAGNITPEQYLKRINEYANMIAPYDLTAAWQLRTEAQQFLEEEYTPLEDPGALGLDGEARGTGERGTLSSRLLAGLGSIGDPGGSRGFSGTVDVVLKLRGNAIKHITQLDGSKYSQYNCTMAAGAMLANAMGVTGLSGADLRNLSGVAGEATNIANLQSALMKVGVDGTRLNWDQRVEFDKFKQRIMNGAPAVLSGWLGDIPSQFNASGLVAGHAMFVAGYDPKRDAFLMLDPAKSKDSGTWWPASVVEDFGWQGQRHGQVLFAPPHTIDPKTLMRAGGAVRHVNVDAPPTKGGPPMTQFDPGPSHATDKLNEHVNKLTRENRERLRDGGVTDAERDALHSEQDVTKLLSDRDDEIGMLQGILDQVTQSVEASGNEFEGQLELVTTGEVLSREDIAKIQKQLIFMYDAQGQLYKSIGEKGKARDQRNLKEGVLVGAAFLNSLEKQFTVNQQMGEVRKLVAGLGSAKSPEEFLAMIEELRGSLDVIGTLNDVPDPKTGRPDLAPLPARAGDDANAPDTQAEKDADRVDTATIPGAEEAFNEWDQLIEVLNGEYDSSEDMIQALDEIMPELSFAQDDEGMKDITDLGAAFAQANAVRSGEGTMIYIPEFDEKGNYTGEHKLMLLPLTEGVEYDAEGNAIEIMVPDISVLGPEFVAEISRMGYDAGSLPKAQVPGRTGVEQIPVIPIRAPYDGVKMLQWGDITQAQFETLEGMDFTSDQVNPGEVIPEDVLALLAATPNSLSWLRSQGFIIDAPWPVQTFKFDGQEWFLDELTTAEGNTQRSWYEGNLPHTSRTPGGTDGTPAPFYSGYYGGVIAPNGNGNVWIDYAEGEMDPTNSGGSFMINLGVTAEQALADLQTTPGSVPGQVYARDPDNPSEAVPIDIYSTQHPLNPKSTTLAQFIRDRVKQTKDIADKIISQMSDPAQADEVAQWDRAELLARAEMMGINQDGTWKQGMMGGTPSRPPDDAILKELGITPAREHDQSQPGTLAFDHLAAAKSGARGVAAATAADRARKAAEAVAAKEAAARAESASALPRISAAPSPSPLPGLGAPKSGTPLPTPGPSPSFNDYKPKATPKPPGGTGWSPVTQTTGDNPTGSRHL